MGLPPECANMEYDELTWEEHRLFVKESVSWEEQGGCLEPIMVDGKIVKEYTLNEVRENFKKGVV